MDTKKKLKDCTLEDLEKYCKTTKCNQCIFYTKAGCGKKSFYNLINMEIKLK